jgi:hypothetical protein
MNLSENEAEQKIVAIIPSQIKAPVIEVIKREAVSKIIYKYLFLQKIISLLLF